MDVACVPRLSASFPARAFFWAGVVEKKEPDYLCGPLWPVRLGVRTPGFHPGSRGSNPLRATSKKGTQLGAFFAFKPVRKACFPRTGGTQKKAAALGGGAVRSLGKRPPPGFADRREAIPSHLNHGQAKSFKSFTSSATPRGHQPASSFIAARISSSER